MGRGIAWRDSRILDRRDSEGDRRGETCLQVVKTYTPHKEESAGDFLEQVAKPMSGFFRVTGSAPRAWQYGTRVSLPRCTLPYSHSRAAATLFLTIARCWVPRLSSRSSMMPEGELVVVRERSRAANGQ